MGTRKHPIPVSRSQTLITGVFRSGTEFITHCLNSHPELSATMYKVNVPRFALGRFDPVAEEDNYTAAVKGIAARMADRYGDSVPVDDILAGLRRHERVDYCVLYDTIMSALYLGGRTVHWAEKNQLLWREIPLFLQGMQNGRAVMILRDPRSVTASFKKFTYAPPPAYLGAIFNCQDALRHAHEYQKRYPGTFLCLRYEDFMRDPLAGARSVWRFLGLDPNHPLTPQEEWRDAYGAPWNNNSCFQGKTGFDVPASLNRGALLSEDELGLAETVCGQWMETFGYKTGSGRKDPDAMRALFRDDPAMTGHFEHWERTGEGFQGFPTDPLDPRNWRRRGKEPLHAKS